MTRLIVDDPVLEAMVTDLAEVISPNVTATVGPWLVCVTRHVGMEAQS
jgi:hypothetical protein